MATRRCPQCYAVTHDHRDAMPHCHLHAAAPELADSLRDTLAALIWYSGIARIDFPEFPESPIPTDEAIAAARAMLASIRGGSEEST